MPRKSKELPEVAIRRLRHKVNAAGQSCKEKYPVGGVSGLYLQCMPPVGEAKIGSRQWILRALVGSKRKEFGLGGYPSVPTKNARDSARKLLADIKSGIDPSSEKKAKLAELKASQAKEITFERYTNAVDKEFAKEMYERIDAKHKDALRRVDYQYRSLKDSIEQLSKKEDRLGYAVDQLGIEGEENEENLKQLMDELRAD